TRAMAYSFRTGFVTACSLVVGSGLVHCASDDDGGGGSSSLPDSGALDGTTSNTNDGGANADGSGDASQGPRCDPKKPFGTPTMLLVNSYLIDQGARLSPDELTLYYASYGHDGVNGQTDLYVAKRASTSVPFTNPTKITELSTD